MLKIDPIIDSFVLTLVPAAKDILATLGFMDPRGFFLIKSNLNDGGYDSIDLPGIDIYFSNTVQLKAFIQKLWSTLEKEYKTKGHPVELVAFITFADTYIEDIKDVPLDEDGRRLRPFVPGPNQPEAVTAQVYQRHRQYMYQFEYKKVLGQYHFKPVQITETIKSPQARLSNLWPEGA